MKLERRKRCDGALWYFHASEDGFFRPERVMGMANYLPNDIHGR